MAAKSEKLKKNELAMAEALTSIRQRKFVMFYVENGGKAIAAAEAAGYAAAAASANDNMKNSTVLEWIEKYAQLVVRNAGESRETILARELNWAEADIRAYFYEKPILDDEGNPAMRGGQPLFTEELKPVLSWTKEEAQRVKKISWNRNGPVLELHDPMRANRHLAEYAGMLQKEDQGLTPDDAATLLAAALDRMDALDAPASSDTS